MKKQTYRHNSKGTCEQSSPRKTESSDVCGHQECKKVNKQKVALRKIKKPKLKDSNLYHYGEDITSIKQEEDVVKIFKEFKKTIYNAVFY